MICRRSNRLDRRCLPPWLFAVIPRVIRHVTKVHAFQTRGILPLQADEASRNSGLSRAFLAVVARSMGILLMVVAVAVHEPEASAKVSVPVVRSTGFSLRRVFVAVAQRPRQLHPETEAYNPAWSTAARAVVCHWQFACQCPPILAAPGKPPHPYGFVFFFLCSSALTGQHHPTHTLSHPLEERGLSAAR
jgi:hypothetical protein